MRSLAESVPNAASLTQAAILKFFLPLALSWVFMSLEGPITAGIVARGVNSDAPLAGLALLAALAIFIEAPVIDLLSTSTTLTKTRRNYREIRTFTLLLMCWVSLVQAVVSCSPFYWVLVEQWIGAQHDVAVALRPAMIVMIPWAAFVGWRRFHQGVMIGHSVTRPIGLGTAVRVVALIMAGVLLLKLTDLSGLVVAAWAMVFSVFAEAVFAHLASLHVLRNDLLVDDPEDSGTSLRQLAIFHFPLTFATMTLIFTMPMTTWALAHSPNKVLTLAAWGLSQGTIFMFRSITFALPETVITLYKGKSVEQELRRFCTSVGLICSGAVVVIYFSGVGDLFFDEALGAKESIAKLAALALFSTMFVPYVSAKAALYRGMLTLHRLTKARLVAILVAVVAMGLVFVAGVALQVDGIWLAGFAMTVQHLVEFAVLRHYWKSSRANDANPDAVLAV